MTSAHFTLRKKIILTLFVLPFPIMVWGVMTQGWWFPVMASAFLTLYNYNNVYCWDR
ncbi:hypothetical protein ACV566_14035 [Staphylococcus aureus]